MAGYLIFEIEITDPDAYRLYQEVAGPIMRAAGGTFVVSSSRIETLEGDWAPPSISLVRFASYEAARQFYHSKAYQDVLGLRQAASNARGILVESLLP
ncbi:MAG: DUF1330 domain-containing protein [Devosia sp.]|nr:DUF1330 domain-containing protein [Devosia sp.]